MRLRGLGGFCAGMLIAGVVLWSLVTTDVELSRLLSAGPRIDDRSGHHGGRH